jgi:hypothetical protein
VTEPAGRGGDSSGLEAARSVPTEHDDTSALAAGLVIAAIVTVGLLLALPLIRARRRSEAAS